MANINNFGLLTATEEQVNAFKALEEGANVLANAKENHSFYSEYFVIDESDESFAEAQNAFRTLQNAIANQKFNFEFAIEVAKQAIKLVVAEDGDINKYFQCSKQLWELKEKFDLFCNEYELEMEAE